MKKILSLSTVIMLSLASLSTTEVQTHGGAGWGFAGGFLGASLIASAANNNRGRDVVYVERPVYVEDRRDSRRDRRDSRRDDRGSQEYEEDYND